MNDVFLILLFQIIDLKEISGVKTSKVVLLFGKLYQVFLRA